MPNDFERILQETPAYPQQDMTPMRGPDLPPMRGPEHYPITQANLRGSDAAKAQELAEQRHRQAMAELPTLEGTDPVIQQEGPGDFNP